MLGVGLVALGLWSFQQLKIEAYPDISDTSVVVITLYPGNASEEVEQQVTIPIERALNNVPHVIARRSRTIFGLSVVELTFADGTDDYFARQVCWRNSATSSCPTGSRRRSAPVDAASASSIATCSKAKAHDEMDLREIQDWIIAPRLAQVEGVADVVTFGGLVKQYHIEVDPLRAREIQAHGRARSPRPWRRTIATRAARSSAAASNRWSSAASA